MSINLSLRDGIPFITAEFINDNNKISTKNILIDTGAGSSILSSDIAIEVGLTPGPNDVINRVRGVGGYEFVYQKSIEKIKIGDTEVCNFTIEVGDMDYGFDIDGILGTDFLRASRAIIDMDKLMIRFKNDVSEDVK